MTKKKIRGLPFFQRMFRVKEEVTFYGDFLQGLSRSVLPSIAKEPANSYTAIGRLSD